MAGLFLAARLWDAINDPIMGSFPDRWTLGKSGDKFKPWVKLFMIPLALSGVLCFANVPFKGVALHAWVAFSYVLYGMCYTGTVSYTQLDVYKRQLLKRRLRPAFLWHWEAA